MKPKLVLSNCPTYPNKLKKECKPGMTDHELVSCGKTISRRSSAFTSDSTHVTHRPAGPLGFPNQFSFEHALKCRNHNCSAVSSVTVALKFYRESLHIDVLTSTSTAALLHCSCRAHSHTSVSAGAGTFLCKLLHVTAAIHHPFVEIEITISTSPWLCQHRDTRSANHRPCLGSSRKLSKLESE